MKILEANTTNITLPLRKIYLNSKPPPDLPGDPPPQPPKEESGDGKPNPHPFDAYWFGFYCGLLGMAQISERDVVGWSEELTAWVYENGWRITDRHPHRFIILKIDPGTKKRIDLPRRDFFRIVTKFKELNEKYDLCLGGLLKYNKSPSAPPQEVCGELFLRGQHFCGDSIGRPMRSRLPFRKRRH